MSKDTVQKLVFAIGQFATYYKRPPITDDDCFDEIGRCLTQPNEFASFARKKFGLDVDTPHYGNGESYYHEVNESGGIVIDWTARQYPNFRTKPYPFVYSADETDKIGFGRLRSISKEVRAKSERKKGLEDSALSAPSWPD